MSSPLFGTDGVRALAGEPPLDAETVSRIAYAFGRRLLGDGSSESKADPNAGPPLVLVGHDGRASADFLVSAIESGLSAAGLDTQETDLITTPGLSTLVREYDARGGVMVSASHNPAHDNGIKLFGRGGEKLSSDDERRIETWVVSRERAPAPSRFGRRRPGSAIRPEIYLGGLVERAGIGPDALRGMRVAFDGAHGGGSYLGPDLLRSLGAEVIEMGSAPNGENINAGVGALHPKALSKLVVARGCAFGVALDGDGDRSMLVDEHGLVIDGDGVIAACAPDLLARGLLPERTVVVSVMSNLGLAARLQQQGIGVDVVPVGDRHLVARLRERSLAIGAEPSGHVIFGADNHFVGDGLYTALRVLDVVRRTGKPLSDLAAFEAWGQVLLNVRVARRDPLDQLEAVVRAQREAEAALGSQGRILLRYSGTEPLARVMVESPDREASNRWATSIADAIRAALA